MAVEGSQPRLVVRETTSLVNLALAFVVGVLAGMGLLYVLYLQGVLPELR